MSFPVNIDEGGPIDEFLLKKGYQQFRIPILLSCGCVTRIRGKSVEKIRVSEVNVLSGDVVEVQINTEYQNRLEHIPISEYRDYIFANSNTTDPWVRMKATFLECDQERKKIWVKNKETLTSFVPALKENNQIKFPIRDIFIVSHAAPNGLLFIPLDLTTHRLIDYEDLENLDPSNPKIDKSRTIVIKKEWTDPRPHDEANKPEPTTVRIRGCSIGNANVFMDILRRVLGVDLVVAPKHLDSIVELQSKNIFLETRLYQFKLISNHKILTKKELLAEFINKEFSLINQTTVPTKLWKEWFKSVPDVISPPNIDQKKPYNKPFLFKIAPPSNELNIRGIQAEYEYYPYQYFPEIPLRYKNNRPGKKADKIKALYDLINTWETYKATHPFPMYKRIGFESLEDFLNSIELIFDADGNLVTGTGYIYELRIPVVDPETNKLYANYYENCSNKSSKKTKSPVRFIGIQENDDKFYGFSRKANSKL